MMTDANLFSLPRRLAWWLVWCACCCVQQAWALPVTRGQTAVIMLTDGSTVRAEARGDEHLVYWQGADGRCYVKSGGTGLYEAVDAATLRSRRRKVVSARRQTLPAQAKRQGRETPSSLLTGQHRGLIILVQFPDKPFQANHTKQFYHRVANEQGFSDYGFKGCVSDYFAVQSGGRFNLSFDVAGPVETIQPYAYYGRNNDEKMGELVKEACMGVQGEVDFSHYDWDHDGVAEEVFVLYAGYGQADHAENDDYIWPHMFELGGYEAFKRTPLVLDRTQINIYACAPELKAGGQTQGIGTICHEFSHCLGLPDMYDTGDSGNYGMGSWDLMDYGCYNDDGFVPAAFTGYERWMCGWSSPVELKGDTAISGMKPLSEGGESYVIYNEENRNEYYLLDNRQLTGYDKALPGHGLLVTHIDYDETAWDYNIVNATGYDEESGFDNTHQRATILHADRAADLSTEHGDPYPYRGRDSLTATSVPAAVLYRPLADGRDRLGLSLLHIAEQADSTVSFTVRSNDQTGRQGYDVACGDTLLYETFDRCAGVGGNDGRFSGRIGSARLIPDHAGWSRYSNGYGGDRCARFGSNYVGTGTVTSPQLALNGDTLTLIFRAAGWDARGDGTSLFVMLTSPRARFVSSGRSDVEVQMVKGAWRTYRLQITGSEPTAVVFSPHRRFFLDDVLVVKSGAGSVETAINRPTATASTAKPLRPSTAYTLDGRAVGVETSRLPSGVYVVGGKKVVR